MVSNLSELILAAGLSLALGICCGTARYLLETKDLNTDHLKNTRNLITTLVVSTIICFTAFTILDLFKLNFMPKVGLSIAIAFFGIEKALDYIERILGMAEAGAKLIKGKSKSDDKINKGDNDV